MNASSVSPAKTLVLLDEGTSSLPVDLLEGCDEGDVIVAAPSRLQLTLASLLLPQAEVIWTDFQYSASVRSLRRLVQSRGGVDRLVIVGGPGSDRVFPAYLLTILTLFPVLQIGRKAELLLCLADCASARSVRAFLDRLAPNLQDLRIRWQDRQMD